MVGGQGDIGHQSVDLEGDLKRQDAVLTVLELGVILGEVEEFVAVLVVNDVVGGGVVGVGGDIVAHHAEHVDRTGADQTVPALLGTLIGDGGGLDIHLLGGVFHGGAVLAVFGLGFILGGGLAVFGVVILGAGIAVGVVDHLRDRAADLGLVLDVLGGSEAAAGVPVCLIRLGLVAEGLVVDGELGAAGDLLIPGVIGLQAAGGAPAPGIICVAAHLEAGGVFALQAELTLGTALQRDAQDGGGADGCHVRELTVHAQIELAGLGVADVGTDVVGGAVHPAGGVAEAHAGTAAGVLGKGGGAAVRGTDVPLVAGFHALAHGLGLLLGGTHLMFGAASDGVGPGIGQGPGGGQGSSVGDRLGDLLGLGLADRDLGLGLLGPGQAVADDVAVVGQLLEGDVDDLADLVDEQQLTALGVLIDQRLVQLVHGDGLISYAGPVGNQGLHAIGARLNAGDDIVLRIGPAQEDIALHLRLGQLQGLVDLFGDRGDRLTLHADRLRSALRHEVDGVGGSGLPLGVQGDLTLAVGGDAADGVAVAVHPALEGVALQVQRLQLQTRVRGVGTGVRVGQLALPEQLLQIGVVVREDVVDAVLLAHGDGNLLRLYKDLAAAGALDALSVAGFGGGGGLGGNLDLHMAQSGQDRVGQLDLNGAVGIVEVLAALGAVPVGGVAVLGTGGGLVGGGLHIVLVGDGGGLQGHAVAACDTAQDQDGVLGVQAAAAVHVGRLQGQVALIAAHQMSQQDDGVLGGDGAAVVHITGGVVDDLDAAVPNLEGGTGDQIAVWGLAGHVGVLVGDADTGHSVQRGPVRDLELQFQDIAVLHLGQVGGGPADHQRGGGGVGGLHHQGLEGLAVLHLDQSQTGVVLDRELCAQDAGVILNLDGNINGAAGGAIGAVYDQLTCGAGFCCMSLTSDGRTQADHQGKRQNEGEDSAA